jgi:hypothetical protein
MRACGCVSNLGPLAWQPRSSSLSGYQTRGARSFPMIRGRIGLAMKMGGGRRSVETLRAANSSLEKGRLGR